MPATLELSQLLIDAFFGVLVLCGGFLLGWWLRRRVLTPQGQSEAEAARRSASRIGDVARGIRGQIDRHRHEIAAALKKIAENSTDDPETVTRGLQHLLEANERLQRELDLAEAKLQDQSRTIEDYATRVRIDTLTQVMNRGTFDEELARRLAEWHRRARPFCVMMLDVDQFKSINDEHGHQAGDQVLQHVAQVLRSTMREMDMLARFGGDEFAVLLPDTNLVEATLAADRLRRRVEGLRVPVDSQSLSLTISLGVAEVLPADNEETVVSRADAALYAAKKMGRNRCCYHDGTQTASMPLGVATRRTASHEGQGIPAELLEFPHPGYSAMLADLVCRVAECQRTGHFLSILLIDVENVREGNADRVELGLSERLAIGECLRATLREMDKCALMGSRQYGAILPGANAETALAVAQRATEGIVALKSHCASLSGIMLRSSTATYRSGDDADSLLARAETGLGADHFIALPLDSSR